MSDITTQVASFLEPLADDDEGIEVLDQQLADRQFVFDLSDADPFVLDASLEDITCEFGQIESPDLVNEVTRVEGDTDSLRRIMRGDVSPLEALNEGDIFMTSMMTARCYNYGLLRAFRRGAEINPCRKYDWQE
ncbi:hypothetical protein [Halobellus marinus]|jgi:hypothetical protein|uniref:hypothetical protein n=1 Tax=Halobellus TaxID=1073986 RepID=UPI0028AB2E4A|nr:hypothetical protein [Halobellus sp. DFY28]